MKTQNVIQILVSPFLMLSLSACGIGKPMQYGAQSASSISNPGGAGGGDKVVGTGAMSVPVADSLVVRITNGMQGNVSPSAGNFATALNQMKNNLPKVTDPTKATGFDQAELLVYAACSDLSKQMAAKYNVQTAGSIASNQAALVNAGMTMLDQHVAGLASGGPSSSKVKQVFTDLVSKVAGTSSNTSTIAFVSVCIAANTAGATLMSY